MLLLLPLPSYAVALEWTQQLGTVRNDVAYGVSADGLGNVYLSGYTSGSLGGPNAGDFDAYVSKYDTAGTLQWTLQLGTVSIDIAHGVSADGLGNVYISGATNGSLGGPNAGFTDAFVSKYDASGTLQWTQQLGTSDHDRAFGVSADGWGNVYISGETRTNAFVSKYDVAGTLQWTQHLGTVGNDSANGVSADELGNVYISGATNGSLGRPNAGLTDAFVSKYDAAGTLLWTQQLGTVKHDRARGVSADGLGNVYLSGYTSGSLGGPNAGGGDAFVSKYDAAGTLQWTQQLGTASSDEAYGVSADGLGNVYIAGSTWGSLGRTHPGNNDAFVSKYDASGTLLWTQQLGTVGNDEARGVSADGFGNVYLSGATNGSLGGPSAGNHDAFVAKISDPTPNPGDYNVDGVVDAADYTVWRDNVGQPIGTLLNDPSVGTTTAPIGAAQRETWRANYGRSFNVGPLGANALPEPAALTLLAGACLATLVRRRRSGDRQLELTHRDGV
ncbi:Beta-propeller repeat protein [Planctomycetes bacterium K2D]|uniref:Beta-propeller repeat protein n=1 Tax=Botrimarina mediterranea TaxID=2528022 RepID=A0A518K6E5_9BACT|nr:Beta-propeller repeat protein [Botrimarina mediterranea]QDV77881.1 Beta-propeller repeat protein [Planctomycetes bacterium K2D]